MNTEPNTPPNDPKLSDCAGPAQPLPGKAEEAADVTDRSSSLQRMVRRIGDRTEAVMKNVLLGGYGAATAEAVAERSRTMQDHEIRSVLGLKRSQVPNPRIRIAS